MERLIRYLANESVMQLETGIERTLHEILNEPNKICKEVTISIEIKKETNVDEIKNKIIIPACFALSNWVNELDKKFNTFVRIKPETNQNNWAWCEYNNVFLIILKEYSSEKELDIMNIQIRITTDVP